VGGVDASAARRIGPLEPRVLRARTARHDEPAEAERDEHEFAKVDHETIRR
jgi:hypothetical protein